MQKTTCLEEIIIYIHCHKNIELDLYSLTNMRKGVFKSWMHIYSWLFYRFFLTVATDLQHENIVYLNLKETHISCGSKHASHTTACSMYGDLACPVHTENIVCLLYYQWRVYLCNWGPYVRLAVMQNVTSWNKIMSRLVTKPIKWLCAQRRLRSAWASAQSDQSLRCALSG